MGGLLGKEEHGSSKCHACQSSAIRTGGKEYRDIKEGDRGVFSFGFRQENGARINANDTQANPVGVLKQTQKKKKKKKGRIVDVHFSFFFFFFFRGAGSKRDQDTQGSWEVGKVHNVCGGA